MNQDESAWKWNIRRTWRVECYYDVDEKISEKQLELSGRIILILIS